MFSEAVDNFGAAVLYVTKCAYLLVSASQLRNGYPRLCIGNLLTRSYGLYWELCSLTIWSSTFRCNQLYALLCLSVRAARLRITNSEAVKLLHNVKKPFYHFSLSIGRGQRQPCPYSTLLR